jgi:hypothetical protein
MVLGVFMRFVHITSVVVLIGAAYYARRTRQAVSPAYRSTIYAGIVTAFLSGLYNFLTKSSYPPHYQMLFGIKFLLGMHVFAALAMCAGRAASEKLERSLTMLMLSATTVILISNYLRWISINPAVALP